MTDSSSKHHQNTLLTNKKTGPSVLSGEDLPAHRQAKVHKTFIVHGRHHIRVPSYGRNLNKIYKNTASTVTENTELLIEPKSPVSYEGLSKKPELLVKKEDVEKNTENTEKNLKEDQYVDDKKEKDVESLKETEKTENLEENGFSSANITIYPLEEKKEDYHEDYDDSSKAEHITKRLVSMTNNQAAVPYLTCETAMVKNIATTQLTSTKEFSSNVLPSSDNLGKPSAESSSMKPPTASMPKYVTSEPLSRNPINRTQQKLLLQRELSLSSVKPQSNKDHDHQEFIQDQINRINKEYSNILRLSDPLKHVILKLFHDGSLEGIKNIPSSLNHKTTEEKLPKNTSKFFDLIGKRENVFKESNKSTIEYNDILSIQTILEEMWKSNENTS
ncbi:hypothetical protein T552_03385 [Pneumocystis carinii B80]|uniref:Uncharacterized protein n=1 Tax=Pneumocystis carinii (strain B80) TaxID=1408658 RepID=A0A0W4ZBR4_PNEC8|nr:hypothetical protein T552_03385 [Pneumocystis carinii B80]KTW25772.1 hypothetical protein T552_03385 [Pneumocystis carinii B80]